MSCPEKFIEYKTLWVSYLKNQQKVRQMSKRALISNSNNSTASVVSELLRNYNRQERPIRDGPTEVKLGIFVNSFYSVSAQDMDYSVSMYLRQSWLDPRLKFTPINTTSSNSSRLLS